MARRHANQRSISVSGKAYDRMRAAADAAGITITELVERATAHLAAPDTAPASAPAAAPVSKADQCR